MGDCKLTCVFRRPRFPIICNIDGELVAGSTAQQFERRMGKVTLPSGRVFKIVDATGEGWVLHTDLSAISPLTLDKRWTKSRVIDMFNTSLNAQRAALRYPPRSLANRRLEAVIRDVVELLRQAERRRSAAAATTNVSRLAERARGRDRLQRLVRPSGRLREVCSLTVTLPGHAHAATPQDPLG